MVYGKGDTQAKLAAAFYCVPVDEDDDDVSEKLRMYKIAGGDVDRYGMHSSYVSLDFSTSDSESVRPRSEWWGCWGVGICWLVRGWSVDDPD